MFRTAKFLFQIAVLIWTGWLIASVGIPWEIGVFLGVLFISGPEGVETYLAHQGVLDGHDTES
jgi:hypothetical protein